MGYEIKELKLQDLDTLIFTTTMKEADGHIT